MVIKASKLPIPKSEVDPLLIEIKPDFKLINEFYPNQAERYGSFKPDFRWFKFKRNKDNSDFSPKEYTPVYTSLSTFLKSKKLDGDANLYFFALTFHRLFESIEFNLENNLLAYTNDAKKLIAQFQELNDSNVKEIESIVFNISNGNQKRGKIQIANKELIAEFYSQLQDWLLNEIPAIPKMKKRSSFFKSFIQNTLPLYNYMRSTHHQSHKTNTKTYEFIQLFLESIGVDFDKHKGETTTPIQYIKDRYLEANKAKPV